MSTPCYGNVRAESHVSPDALADNFLARFLPPGGPASVTVHDWSALLELGAGTSTSDSAEMKANVTIAASEVKGLRRANRSAS